MALFADTQELYSVFDDLLTRVAGDRDIAEPLLAGDFVLRMRYSDPDAMVTVDLRGPQLEWQLDRSELKPDLELIQSADVAHQFWLGKLNIPLAIASRRIVSRGSLTKALALLPAVEPAFPLYEEVLRDQGLAQLIPSATSRPARSGGLRRVRAWWSAARRALRRRAPHARSPRPAHARHYIPLQENPVVPAPLSSSMQQPRTQNALKTEMLRRMSLIRAFEGLLAQTYADGSLPTEAIHLSIGQEATAVGACFALRTHDYLATTHRGHGHMLAKGAPADRMLAEIMGKSTGLCRGKGGSMHVTDASVGAIGANGIVGASPLIAAGAAHSIQKRGTDQVAVAFFGDGATNQGMFHEAANFAAVFDLPVIFVLENNQYGEFTPLARHTRVEKLQDRALAYNMRAATVDGNDVWAVYEAMREAREHAVAGRGPTLLVCETYRWNGHMEGESYAYRPDEEVAAWKERCPIESWRRHIVGAELLTDRETRDIDEDVNAEIARALEFARRSPEPGVDQLTTDIFSPEPSVLYRAPSVSPGPERSISYSQAVREALAEEMRRDPSVYLLGEDVRGGGYFSVTTGLADEFGGERIIDTPISEYAIVGSAVGASMTGSRPVAEILFSDFLTTCMDPLVNNAAKLRYMSGGQYQLPMVVRTPGGGGLGMAAQHSQSFEALLAGVAGLIIVAPSTPRDAKGLLKAAIRSNNPVVVFENKLLYATIGPVPESDDFIVPIGVADIKRAGDDVTVVTIGGALITAMEAAESLQSEGISVEVIDPRTLVPLDLETIIASVRETGRLVTVEEAAETHGFGGEITALIAEYAFNSLKAAPRRVAALDVPIPYNAALERRAIPDVERVKESIRAVMGR